MRLRRMAGRQGACAPGARIGRPGRIPPSRQRHGPFRGGVMKDLEGYPDLQPLPRLRPGIHRPFLPSPRKALMKGSIIPAAALSSAFGALTLAAAIGIALASSGCSSSAAENAGGPPPAQVSVAPVLVQTVRQWDEYTGRVAAVDKVELRPRVSGYV